MTTWNTANSEIKIPPNIKEKQNNIGVLLHSLFGVFLVWNCIFTEQSSRERGIHNKEGALFSSHYSMKASSYQLSLLWREASLL